MKKFYTKSLLESFLNKNKLSAFSLIEFALVITVVSVVVAGILSFSVSSKSNNRLEVTNNNIKIVYKALKEYVLANKRLPCPAPITLTKSKSDLYGGEGGSAGGCDADGVYSSLVETSSDSVVYGMLPIRALGLKNKIAEDGFGNKMAYVVEKGYTSSASFSTENKVMKVRKYGIYDSSVTYEEESDAIFVIVSFGENKAGAFGANSANQREPSADFYESHNAIVQMTGFAREAYFTDNFVSYTEGSDVFDDIVFYKDKKALLRDSRAEFLTGSNITKESK